MSENAHPSLRELFQGIDFIIDADINTPKGRIGFQKLEPGDYVEIPIKNPMDPLNSLTAVFKIKSVTLTAADHDGIDSRKCAFTTRDAFAAIAQKNPHIDVSVIELDKENIRAAYPVPMQRAQVTSHLPNGQKQVSTRLIPLEM